VERFACAANVAYFTHHYCLIDDAQGLGEGGAAMPFRLWPAQVGVLRTLTHHKRIIILKARQLGISWLCCAYALWLCLFHPGKVVLLFSKGKMEAIELLRRVGVLYDRLPDWMKQDLPARIKDNTEAHEWSNGSRIQSMPATESAGRSFTASLIVLDEFAFMTWGGKLYTAAKPTIDAGGQMIVLSTAKGIGNAFHQLWLRASSHANDFRAVFLPYTARPGRGGDWRARQIAESVRPEEVLQEYPATATESFIASGRARFQKAWIEAQAVGKVEAQVLAGVLAHIPGVEVYAWPQAGAEYVLCADVAEGGEGGDWDDGVVMERATRREVASIRGQWEPRVFAAYLSELSTFYNRAMVTPERNNHGHAVIGKLLDLGARVGVAEDGKYGWLTNSKTKPMMIDYLAEVLKDGLACFNSGTAIHEMSIYETKPDGGTGAPSGYYDDALTSRAIACMMLKRPVREYHYASA